MNLALGRRPHAAVLIKSLRDLHKQKRPRMGTKYYDEPFLRTEAKARKALERTTSILTHEEGL